VDLIDLDDADDEAKAVGAAPARHGFLPIATNWFDRLFIAIYIGVALELLWMRFLEQAVPLMVAHVIVLALGVFIIRKG
jgi:predicted small integral membrane protein